MTDLLDLGKLGTLIGKAARSIGTLGESVAKIVRLSAQGYDAVGSRREKTRLKDLVRRADRMTGIVNPSVIDVGRSLYGRQFPSRDQTPRLRAVRRAEEFLLTDDDGRAQLWKEHLRVFEDSIVEIEAFLGDLGSEGSDFVLEAAYRNLVSGLASRRAILRDLAKQPAPKTRGEIDAIVEVLIEYERLRSELIQSRKALSEYVKGMGSQKQAKVATSARKSRGNSQKRPS